jgi:hypothetical protein
LHYYSFREKDPAEQKCFDPINSLRLIRGVSW